MFFQFLRRALAVTACFSVRATAQHSMPGVLGVPMDRMGSGTTWIPDAVSLPSHHAMAGAWTVMAHGFVFGQYDRQGGPRGNTQWGSLNWGMLMASHNVAGGVLQLRTMLSLDPATVTSRGYPLLLQSGESFRGEPLHDRQHPHDFWMELGVLYDHEVSRGHAIEVYLAPAGEPALGPVAFMHRPSAMDDPTAPLGHHWQDATHISFGVATVSVYSTRWKLEGSIFNGREPNDRRWDFDFRRMDSYSARLTVNPNAHWSATAGYGLLRSVEATEPDESSHRLVASVMHGRSIGMGGQWTSTFVLGANTRAQRTGLSTGVLVESELVLNDKHTFMARAEAVQKTVADLSIADSLARYAGDYAFNIRSISLGYVRELGHRRGMSVGIGARGTINLVPRELESSYGSRTPAGAMVFLRLRPSRPSMAGMPGMTHHEP
jgi:hypothetical protein